MTIRKEIGVAEPTQNDRLETLRELSSLAAAGDEFNKKELAEFGELFIKLDIEALEGNLPDGWALNKLSKSRSAGMD